MTDERPYTIRETLAAMVLEHDAGGITMATLREARQHLAEDEAATGWQPIETAPKDGSVTIDLWGPFRGRVTDATWNAEQQRWDYWDASDLEYRAIDDVPTHWMPLPNPPEVVQDAG